MSYGVSDELSTSSAIAAKSFPTFEQIAKAKALNKKGLHLQAWKVVSDCADFRTWPSGESRRLAASFANRLGSSRWSDVLDWRNWRAQPENPEWFFQAQFVRLGQGRWWEAFQATRDRLEAGVESPKLRADMMALLGWLHGRWRDFDRAFPLLEQAIASDESRSWPFVEKASVLQIADRREEAVEVIEHALTLYPNYRPAAVLRVELLQELRREEEAEEYLRALHRETENPTYAARLHILHAERDDWRRALDYLDDYENLSPLLDRTGKEWLAARRADLYLEGGDLKRFFACAEETGKVSFQKRVAQHLRDTEGQEHQKKKLPVPFIRQHSMTCAPATLASLAAFWGKDEDHLAIAEAICYNGTPWHKERDWAREHGFVTREFKVTAASTKALIDRGVPFTMSTAWTTGAHLQACVGYDEFQDCAVIRDPTSRHSVEMSFEGLAKDHPVQGPRGMVIIPREKAELLDGLEFPDEAVYDAHHDFSEAIEEHRRPDAESALVRMVEAGGEDHPCVWWCRQRLARYDSNAAEELVWLDKLIERFPKTEKFRYWRLNILQRLSRRDEREKTLREVISRGRCSTVFYSELGELYAEDDRDYVMANHYLRKAMRVNPTEEVAYASLANAKWRRFEREEALELHRIASTLSPHFEPYANEYFDACVVLGHRDQGLEFLQKRVETLGQRSGAPWMTLIRAYARLGRTTEAKAKLTEACQALPEDGELLLEAAERLSYWGESQDAWDMLERARGVVAERRWHEAVGRMAGFLGEREKAIAAWKEVARLAPALMPAHRALARYQEEREDGGALRYLKTVLANQPDHPNLLGLYAEWCGADEAAESAEALRRALAILPNWDWAIRELALQLELLGEKEEALAEARRAAALSEFDCSSWGILGSMLLRQNQPEEAEECLKKALQLDIDYTWAISQLMGVMRRRGAFPEALAFLREEIEKQVSIGDAVFAYREHAFREREPEALLDELRQFCEQRPDLWQTWSAVKDQALDMDRIEVAGKAAGELVRRFPLMPRSYSERAQVAHATGDYEAEIADLQKALEISPSWDFAARRLSEAYERCERYGEALEAIEQAAHAEPLVAANHGMAARLMAMKGDSDEAFARMKRAVRVDYSYDYGWGELTDWAKEQNREEEVRTLLDDIDPAARHHSGWWDTKRWVLNLLGEGDAALAVAREAVERFPTNLDLRDNLALLLCERGEYEEALKECQPPTDGQPWQRTQAGRHAWIQMEAGYPREAISATRELVEKEPDYIWAWGNLMRWYYQRENWKECLEAARRVNRLDPNDAPAWGHRGDAARKLEYDDEALECFEKAYRLDPEYSYGGRELLELYVEKAEYEQARGVWRSLSHFSPTPFVHVDGITIELADKKLDRVAEMTDELLAMEFEESTDPLQYAEWAFNNYKQTALWDERLSQRIKEEPSRAIVSAWARACIERGHLAKSIKKLKKLPVPFAKKAGAWALFLERLKELGDHEGSNKLVNQNWQDFQSDPVTWTEAGYNLLYYGTPAEAVRWFGDWRERGESVTARDYLNLSSAAVRNHDLVLAREAIQSGLYRFRTGLYAECLRCARRFLDEVEGQHEAADEMDEIGEPSEGLPFYQSLSRFSDAIRRARQGETESAEADFLKVANSWGQWTSDALCTDYLNLAADRLAHLIPKYRGKSKKLVAKAKKEGGVKTESSGTSLKIFLLAVWLIYLISRVSQCSME
ncbi:hypothetical protein GCM10007100_29460 [Roseibacillus persicicus]|uniref:Peptidase C39-like domain-containing protein n=1 Tax=Roseibacillus persicicus TaxID=454148 RepID=A0A918TRS2_9BACT|nr:hypothetical protein GCM10007100_29460 [Roseibacillus persicicus]